MAEGTRLQTFEGAELNSVDFRVMEPWNLLLGWLSYPAWLCQQFAIENGHRNSGIIH